MTIFLTCGKRFDSARSNFTSLEEDELAKNGWVD